MISARRHLPICGAGLLVLLAAGCGEAPVEAPPEPTRPPEFMCEQARSALQRVRGDFLFEDSGAAMMDRERWLKMSESARGRIFQNLATLAACASETPIGEVRVTIRDSFGGRLDSRTVSPATRTGL